MPNLREMLRQKALRIVRILYPEKDGLAFTVTHTRTEPTRLNAGWIGLCFWLRFEDETEGTAAIFFVESTGDCYWASTIEELPYPVKKPP